MSLVLSNSIVFTQHDAEKFVKKVLGENEIEAVLHRLDRLTQDEVRATGAQTLEVVCGLVQHRKVVMDGEANCISHDRHSLMNFHISRPRRRVVGAQRPGGYGSEFLKGISRFKTSDLSLELMHTILSDINRSKRELFLDDAVAD